MHHEASTPLCDVFFSFNGAQERTATDLHARLSQLPFTTFLDAARLHHIGHELHDGHDDDHPHLVAAAAEDCLVAIVVVSIEFVSSISCMSELCSLVDAGKPIVPLFFELSPEGLLQGGAGLEAWKPLITAHKDYISIDVTKWADALKVLCSSDTIFVLEPHAVRQVPEECIFNEIVYAVCQRIPPSRALYDTHNIIGMKRLSQVVLDKFEQMELQIREGEEGLPASQCAKASVLILVGVGGAGKTTLCQRVMHEQYFSSPLSYHSALYLQLLSPYPSLANMVHIMDTTSSNRLEYHNKRIITLEEVEPLLRSSQFPSSRVFMVVDDISPETVEATLRILNVGVGHGSRVVLVTRFKAVLQSLLHKVQDCHAPLYTCDGLVFPSIDEKEARELLLHTVRTSGLKDEFVVLNSENTVRSIARMCCFDWNPNVYHPSLVKVIGLNLLRNERWTKDSDQMLWRRMQTYRSNALKDLIVSQGSISEFEFLVNVVNLISRLKFKETVKMVAGFLSIIHGCSVSTVRMMMERSSFLQVLDDGTIKVPNVLMEGLVESMNENGTGWWYFSGTVGRDTTWQGAHDFMPFALILDQLGEGCATVTLEGFSLLRVVSVRNCRSLRVLTLTDLSSLACLDIENCARLKHLVFKGKTDITKIQWVGYRGPDVGKNYILGGKVLSIVVDQAGQSVLAWFSFQPSNMILKVRRHGGAFPAPTVNYADLRLFGRLKRAALPLSAILLIDHYSKSERVSSLDRLRNSKHFLLKGGQNLIDVLLHSFITACPFKASQILYGCRNIKSLQSAGSSKKLLSLASSHDKGSDHDQDLRAEPSLTVIGDSRQPRTLPKSNAVRFSLTLVHQGCTTKSIRIGILHRLMEPERMEFFFFNEKEMASCIGVGWSQSKVVLSTDLCISIYEMSDNDWEGEQALGKSSKQLVMEYSSHKVSEKKVSFANGKEMSKVCGVGFDGAPPPIYKHDMYDNDEEMRTVPLLYRIAHFILGQVNHKEFTDGSDGTRGGNASHAGTSHRRPPVQARNSTNSSFMQKLHKRLNLNGGGADEDGEGGEDGQRSHLATTAQEMDGDLCEILKVSIHPLPKRHFHIIPGNIKEKSWEGLNSASINVELVIVFHRYVRNNHKEIFISALSMLQLDTRQYVKDDPNKFGWCHPSVCISLGCDEGRGLETTDRIVRLCPESYGVRSSQSTTSSYKYTSTEAVSSSIGGSLSAGGEFGFNLCKVKTGGSANIEASTSRNCAVESSTPSICDGFLVNDSSSSEPACAKFNLSYSLENYDKWSSKRFHSNQGVCSTIKPCIEGTWIPYNDSEASPYVFIITRDLKLYRRRYRKVEDTICCSQSYELVFYINHALSHLTRQESQHQELRFMHDRLKDEVPNVVQVYCTTDGSPSVLASQPPNSITYPPS